MGTPAKYRAVFFDADDTLFDYPLAERVALVKCRRRFRLQAGEETLVAAYRRINSGLWRAYERKEIRQEEIPLARFRRLIDDLGLGKISPQAMSDYYLEALSLQAQLCHGAEDMLAELYRRYHLAVVTNGIARVQRSRLERSGLMHFFATVVISEEIGLAKPDPRVLWPALEALNVSPLEVLFVGDGVTSDMACARAAGCDFCWYNPAGEDLPADFPRPRFEIRTLPELLALI